MAEPAQAPELMPAAPSSAPAELLYRSAMLRRFGPLVWGTGLGWLLKRLKLSERSAERVRKAAERGPVVYVMHTWSRLDWLALNRVLNENRLPLARYTHGFQSSAYAPLGDALSGLSQSLRERLGAPPPDPLDSGWLVNAVSQGVPTAIFLVQRLEVLQRLTSGPLPDPLEALMAAQERIGRPVQLVPVVVLWSRGPEEERTRVERAVLGSADDPTWLNKLGSILTLSRQSRGVVEVGEPVDLRELMQRKADLTPQGQRKAARLLLRRFLYRTAHVIRGPGVRPYRWMRRLVLDSPEVRKLVHDEAAMGRRTPDEVREEASRTLDRVAARLSFPVMRVLNWGVNFLWERIYSGIDVRPQDLDRIRDAVEQGAPVLVPCHRSHLDYMLISTLLYKHDVVIPHIVAGDNLAFWPLGPLARRVGAVFIKRSFKGERIFPVVFQRYLKQLLRDGFPVEFFIEGTRSRSGKLLPARHGVLGMVVDAAAEGREDREITLLPIAISYEQIAEERAYARELGGEAKKKEDIGELARASKVIRHRYGRVYLRVGEPIPLKPLFRALPAPWASLDRDHRHEVLQALGEKLIYRISANMIVLPTGVVSMALLAQARRGIRHTELLARCHRLVDALLAAGATPAASLSGGTRAFDEALRRFSARKLVARLSDEEGDILQVIDERRITLEYYKNGLLHFLVPASLLAAAIGAVVVHGEAAATRGPDDAEVARLFQLQIFLLRYEFTLDPEATVEDHLASARAALLRYGALVERDGALALGELPLLAELAGLTRNMCESYMLVLRGARALRSRDIAPEDLPRRIQEVGRGLLAVDELRRPEALSVENLKNGVRAFREDGVLQVKVGGGGLQFEERQHRQYMDDLTALLGLAAAKVEAG